MSVLTYKCRNCGSALTFNAEAQNWSCDACLSIFKLEDLQEAEKEALKQVEPEMAPTLKQKEASETLDTEFQEQTKAYKCPSCGAEIVTDATTAATFCLYCHNPTILPSQLAGAYRPSKVIPFTFKKEEVTKIFLKWCSKKPLLPKEFKSQSQVEKLTGIYIPYWLYDCEVNGDMNAIGRNVRSWRVGDMQYTETKTYDVYRSIHAAFDRVPADGSKRADDDLMERLEPYDYSEIKDFSMSYLSGYLAEKYDVDSKEVFPRIQNRVEDYSHSLLRDTIVGYSSVQERAKNIRLKDVRYEYALLPAWMLTYEFKGKRYFFAMNGQTGKIAGKLPLSTTKAALYFAGISLIGYIVMLLGGMLV